MTTCVLRFAVPPERLGHDASRYMEPEIGPTWPQETHQVLLQNLKSELQNPEKADPLMKQLETRGFAVAKNKSHTMGSLASQAEWNAAYLEVRVVLCRIILIVCRKQPSRSLIVLSSLTV
jgi:hypothetical protein